MEHAVSTIVNTIIRGHHFYWHNALPDSLVGYTLSLLDQGITNTSHIDLLSGMQSFATFYEMGVPDGSSPPKDDDDMDVEISHGMLCLTPLLVVN